MYAACTFIVGVSYYISTDDDSHRTIGNGNEEGGKKILHKILKLQKFVTFFLREFNIHKTHDEHTAEEREKPR